MEVILVKEAEADLDEKRIPEAFEKDLTSLEEGESNCDYVILN